MLYVVCLLRYAIQNLNLYNTYDKDLQIDKNGVPFLAERKGIHFIYGF